MDNALVSVVIPAYNHEKYVQSTIQSIINQTYKNIELIILDDGSKDSTWAKINELKEVCEQRFIHIHFGTKQNEGTSTTLNKLINLTKGEFVYLIASDDLAKPQAIEKEIDFLSKNPEYALAVGNNEIIDIDGNVCYWDKKRNIVYKKSEARFITFGDLLQNKRFKFSSKKFGTYETLYANNYIPNGYLIRKSVLDKIKPFTKEAPLEDWFLMLQISKYAKMKYIDEVLFSYRWHSSNTIKNNERMKEITLKTIQYESQIIKEINLDEIFYNIPNVIKNGVIYKRCGIPFILEVVNYKKEGKRIKVLKIFNIKVYEFIEK